MSRFQIFIAQEIDALRRGGRILHDALAHVAWLVAPGVTTAALDDAAEAFIRDHGAAPAFKGYRGFPATLCTSVNDACVHGVPGSRVLRKGDIVSIDCGVRMEGLCTDACVTVPVGDIDADAARLLRAADEALAAAIAVTRAGARVGDISAAVQASAEMRNCHPVPALTGHGLGTDLHQFPDVPNLGIRGTGPLLPASTILAIEPILTLGGTELRTEEDGWTLVTKDGSLCAHAEHTVLVLPGGCDVLT